MPVCLYCELDKPDIDMTLEHVIPQFMGGAYAPDRYKVRRACKDCNSNLGLFVDAGFAKSILAIDSLLIAEAPVYDPESPTGLPLNCLGLIEFAVPDMKPDECCEYYLGPLGESIFWVRHHDENLYWLQGGNPRTTKKRPSRAYYFPSPATPTHPDVAWKSFRDSFPRRKVRKILGDAMPDGDPAEMGFTQSDELDRARIAVFQTQLAEANFGVRSSVNLDADYRFIAKLARGVGFAWFGDRALQGHCAAEIRKAFTIRPGAPTPNMRGSGMMDYAGKPNPMMMGHKYGITLTVTLTAEGALLAIDFSQQRGAIIGILDRDLIQRADAERLRHGKSLILFPALRTSVELGVESYIGHVFGRQPHPELQAIEERLAAFQPNPALPFHIRLDTQNEPGRQH